MKRVPWILAALGVAAVVWFALAPGDAARVVDASPVRSNGPPSATASASPATKPPLAAASRQVSLAPSADDPRGRRDAMRSRIHEALRLRHPPVGDSAPAEDDDLPPGKLHKTYIQETISAELVPLVRECYDELLRVDPNSQGRVVMQFDIVGDESVGGIVDDVELTDETELSQEDFAECVRESMASVTFDPPEGGGIVRVTYPLVFVADSQSADNGA